VRCATLSSSEPLRHVIERVREQAQFVARFRGNIDVELAGAHGTRSAHQLPDGRDQPPCQQQRHHDGEHHEERYDRERADQIDAQPSPAAIETHPESDVADDLPTRTGAGDAGRSMDGDHDIEKSPGRGAILDCGHPSGGGQGDRCCGRDGAGVAVREQ